MNFKFSASNAAINRIVELSNKEEKKILAFRVKINGGGCNGFMYDFSLETDKIDKDDIILPQDGVNIVIDKISTQFLNECILEYTAELGSSFFHISNPNAKAKCGCGNSFSI